MPDRYCPNCGNGVKKSDSYCLKCGTEVPSLDSEGDANLHDVRGVSSSDGSHDKRGRPEDDDGVGDELGRGSPQHPQTGDSLETSVSEVNDEGSDDESSGESQYSVEDVPPGEPPPDSLRPRTDEHDWPGALWVGLNWVGLWLLGMGVGLVIVIGIFAADDYSLAEKLVASVAVIILYGGLMYLYYRFIRAVRDFHKIGWIVLSILLPLSFVGSLITLLSSADPAAVGQSVVHLPLSALWMWYFWSKREHYGISVG